MDNKEILNEQNTDQSAEKQELTSIERAKALFEYEMTEVLLNFKNEVRAVKDSPAAEYINMEVPKSGVAYDAPDIAVEGIGYTETAADVALDADALQIETSAAFGGEVPEVPEITLDSGFEAKLDEAAFAPAVVSVREVKLADSIAADLTTVAPEVPEVPELDTEALFAVPAEEFDLPSVAVPDARTEPTVFDIPPAEMLTVPAIHADAPAVDTASLTAGEAAPVAVEVSVELPGAVSVPEIDAPELRPVEVEVSEIAAPAVPDLTIREAELPAVELPAVPAVSLRGEPPAIQVTAEVAVPEVQVPVPPTIKLTAQEPAAIEYPEIPECPDFSAYYADITETLQNEL